MATRYNVAGQTDLENTATWSATQHGSGGASVPTTGDDVFILNGSADLTGDIDTDTSSITIGGQFSGSIGTSGDPTIIGCDGDVLVEGAKMGDIYLDASATYNVASMTINAPNSNVVLAGVDGGDNTRVVAKNCRSLTMDGIVLNFLYLGGNIEPIPYHATAITTIDMLGGRIELGRSYTTATLDRRAQLIVRQIDTSNSAPSGGTARMLGNSTYNHRSSGTVTTANVYDATYTPAGADVGHTVTALNRYGGPGVSRFVKNAGPVTVTVGTDNNYGGSGDLTQDTLGGIPNSI